LLASLKKAVSANDLNVVFDVGPTEAAAKRDIHIHRKPGDLIGENDLLNQLTRLLAENALDAGGNGKHELVVNAASNTRKGDDRGVPCPPGPFRVAADPQAPDPLGGLRRQDPVAVMRAA
jgi:hypothetical protein